MRVDREALVRQRFAQRMSESLPQFGAASFGEHWPELLCYRWAIAADLAFFVTLKAAPSEDRFSVLLTWMLTGRPPIHATPGAPNSPPNQDGLTIDMSLLWSHSAVAWKVKYAPPAEELSAWEETHGVADEVRDEEIRKVYPRVDDAVDRVRALGLAYFKTIADRHGKAWP
jgi:hypothetical protein